VERKELERKPHIRDIRRQYGLTSRAVADAAGIDLYTEYLLEIGGPVSNREIEQVLQALSHLTGEQFTRDNVRGLGIPANRIARNSSQINIVH
jgi:transcriptional regulator with XRE-family HTH domain